MTREAVKGAWNGDAMKKRLILGLVLAALASVPAHAGLFGESDEEKAARLHEQDQDATIRDLGQRVHDLEDSLRQATGQNESLAHQIQQLNEKISRQQKDFEYRLCTVAAQQLGATGGEDQSALPCGGGAGVSQSFSPPPPQAQANVPPGSPVVRLVPPPGSLGTLPANGANAAPAASPDPQAQGRFNAALDLLAKARYEDARAAFRGFADANPDDPLAPQALYWVGDIAFVQKDYANAARSFAEGVKKYPASTRGPDSMLKLGQSLIELGQTKEGCMTLGALNGKYPNASKTVLGQAAAERKASCH